MSVDDTAGTRPLGDTRFEIRHHFICSDLLTHRGAPWASSLPSLHVPLSGGHKK